VGHKYSGRHLDGITDVSEILHFAKIIIYGLFDAYWNKRVFRVELV